ncbi:MAG: hypothetical protein NC123_14550 [Butyrivibrio sp.]|nr:hypothetical protein [Butyrivibrio sp.]
MQTDIRLVKLTRTTLEGKRTTLKEKRTGLTTDNSWFVADYFDVMEIDALSLQDSFAQWMGIGIDSDDDNVITEQSYTLYCNSNMLTEYEGNRKIPYRGNPFEEQGSNDYLSIIHVYILPEILARMNISEGSVWGDKEILLQPFIEDLYDIMDLYAEKNAKESFIARVYLMLSAGDFAVVIRSEKSNVAYNIATYFRRRKAGKGKESCKECEYVIYKTYTLSTIGRKIIKVDEKAASTESTESTQTPDRFIVRGSYSNKYWKNQDEVRKFLSQFGNNIEGLHPLSGRYDFTVRLQENEFRQVMSVNNNKVQTGEKQRDKVRCLKCFIEEKYITSINERYLMDGISLGLELSDDDVNSKSVFLHEKADEGDDLDEKNKKQIEALLEQYGTITEQCAGIKGYRKNIQQYLHLLKRQIILCKNINELSDTRIYAAMLIKLLKVTLNSVGEYAEKCSNCEEDKWLDALENNLRKSIVTLDSYAQYIRNNNLQSMQTPNYNIDTSMGVEKVLIGYSELLWYSLKIYQKIIEKNSEEDHLTVMIPNLNCSSLNIDVMFPESEAREQRLTVIGSPTLEEITDFPIIFPALFHEIAHQFRYKNREVRNRAILKATVREIMYGVSQYLAAHIIEKAGAAESEVYALRHGLEIVLTDLFVSREKDSTLADKSLIQFETDLYNDINKVFSIWKWKSDLEERVEAFFNELKYELDCADQEVQDWTAELLAALNRARSENATAAPDIVEKNFIYEIIKYAFLIAGKCVYQYIGDTGNVDNKMKILAEETDDLWETKWKKICDENMCDKPEGMRKINSIFLRFLDSMEEYKNNCLQVCSSSEKDWMDEVNRVKKLEDQAYTSMKIYWEEVGQKSAAVHSLDQETDSENMAEAVNYRNWIRIGRYLGLDYDTKKSKFLKVIENELDLEERVTPSFLGLYREETSDIFMCNVMQMEPLEYVNLMVSLLVPVDNRYAGTDVERLFCVLYIQWCYERKKSKKVLLNCYLQVCCDIFKKTCENARELLSAIGMKDAAGNFPYDEITYGTEICEFEELKSMIEEDIMYLSNYRREMSQNSEAVAELNHMIRVYSLLIDLMSKGTYYCSKLHENGEVLEDLAREKKKWENFYKIAREDHVMSKIFEAGSAIKAYLSRAHSRNVAEGKCAESKGNINEKCVEILLMMYYHNKIRTAQEGREKSTDEN